jgi:type VI secretion system secreted protein VgrG
MASDRVAYTQAGRMVAIDTPLGNDQLLLDHVDIHESVNGLFTIRANTKSQRDSLQAGDLIGSSVNFTLQLKDGGTRAWNGFVTDLHEGTLTTRGTRNYGLTVRPKLWLLSQKSDCRIFQDQATPQIIETLCGEHGITDFDLRITGNPAPQHYSVQWNETDLAYMLRRM